MPTQVVGRRVAAFIIDGLVFAALEFAIFFALAGDKVEAFQNGDLHTGDTTYVNLTIGDTHYGLYGANAGVYFLIVFLLWLGYFVVWPGLKGVTLGKLALGIKVVKDDGSGRPPGVLRAFVRYLLIIVDDFPYIIPMLTGFICALNSKENKRVGDMVASTVVIKKDAALSPAATTEAPPPGIPFQS
jgi:uncharacterized RDD family membrane protein YckC